MYALTGKRDMARKNHWVVRRGGGWGVRGEGNIRDTSRHSTQLAAITAATDIARHQKTVVLVQNRRGQIRERYSYGNGLQRRRADALN